MTSEAPRKGTRGTYRHGSTSGTSTTPKRQSFNVPCMPGLSRSPAQSGSPKASSQIDFQTSSKKSSGSIFSGYRKPSTASSATVLRRHQVTPRKCSAFSGASSRRA